MAKKFDPDLMETIKRVAIPVDKKTKVIVEAYSYDDGPVKISTKSMLKKANGEWIYTKFSGVADPAVARKIGKTYIALSKLLEE